MTATTSTLGPSRLSATWLAGGVAAIAGAAVLGTTVGAADVPTGGALLEVIDHLPLIDLDSGLTERQATIVWELRFPRVVLGLLVGGLLALAGGAYQGVFRNSLADPYLLGAAAGGGLGATLAIVAGLDGAGLADPLPLAAFAGAFGAVMLTYLLGGSGERRRSPATLLLAGVAVASLLTAIQTFVQQRESDTIREVYAWILGRLTTAGWDEVLLLVPYAAVSVTLVLIHRRVLDVLTVGDDEATSLGIPVDRARLLVVLAASLATAAAVAVSGLIGFVGIIVPHTVRLLGGASYRIILPASLLLGGAFLVVADVVARQALAPAEIPIGVVTAFFGAPFFLMLLRLRRAGSL
jgi:iron complex transport system permease protein